MRAGLQSTVAQSPGREGWGYAGHAVVSVPRVPRTSRQHRATALPRRQRHIVVTRYTGNMGPSPCSKSLENTLCRNNAAHNSALHGPDPSGAHLSCLMR